MSLQQKKKQNKKQLNYTLARVFILKKRVTCWLDSDCFENMNQRIARFMKIDQRIANAIPRNNSRSTPHSQLNRV